MKGVVSFETLQVWQRAHFFALEIYKVTTGFPKDEAFGVISQLRRAALSIPTNIAEGYARHNNRVLRTFLDIAYGSLIEARYLLMFSKEVGYLSDSDFVRLTQVNEEIGGLLWKFKESIGEKEQEKIRI